MAYPLNVTQQYKQNSVITATPAELTLKLYQGLVKFLKLALVELDQQNLQGVNMNLIKGQDILRELLCTLDMKIPISKDMAAMYEYMLQRCMEANIKKDRGIIEEILGFAQEFCNTWLQAMKVAK